VGCASSRVKREPPQAEDRPARYACRRGARDSRWSNVQPSRHATGVVRAATATAQMSGRPGRPRRQIRTARRTTCAPVAECIRAARDGIRARCRRSASAVALARAAASAAWPRRLPRAGRPARRRRSGWLMTCAWRFTPQLKVKRARPHSVPSSHCAEGGPKNPIMRTIRPDASMIATSMPSRRIAPSAARTAQAKRATS
jgi:hypothetical protein